MAVTAVSFKIIHLQRFDGKQTLSSPVLFSNISANPAIFLLAGGSYALECIGSTFGTVTLQVLGPDGTTYLTAATAFSTNGTSIVSLPAGTYKLALA